MKFGQYQPSDMETAKNRRRAEEECRNERAYTEARKADVLKKQRKIQECQEQILRMDRYAERCLLEGQEQKASVYLERKLEWQNRLAVLIEEAGFAVAGTTFSEAGTIVSEAGEVSQEELHPSSDEMES